MIHSERLLEIREILTRFHHQPVHVEQRIACPCFVDTQTLKHHRLADQFGNAGPRRTAAQKQETLVNKLLLRDVEGGENARQRDGCGALDVVVIGADLVLVTREQRDGIEVREVFPLDAAFRMQLLRGFHELVHERVIFVAPDTFLTQAEIKRIVEQVAVIGAHIQHHRQAILRRYARARGVEREFADRNAHPAHAQIA